MQDKKTNTAEAKAYCDEKTAMKVWAVTGTFHGSLITAVSEGDARRAFHEAWNGESITHISSGAERALFNL